MTEEKIPNPDKINEIPKFMQAVKDTYGIDVPIELESNHPLSDIWTKNITVTEGISPDPSYTATGSISDEFPFNFAESAQLKPTMNLKIEVFDSAAEFQSRRGTKVTIFYVQNSIDNSTYAIVSNDQSIPPEISNR